MSFTPPEVGAHRQNLFNEMAGMFSDVKFFGTDIAPFLMDAIKYCESTTDLGEAMVKTLTKQYHSKTKGKSERLDNDPKENSKKSKMIKLILQTLCVLIVSKRDKATQHYYQDLNELLDHYPQFQNLGVDQKDLLLKFRNMMRACLCFMKGRLNKKTIIDISGRLEGTQREYITGSGQRDAVKHRVAIYEQESLVKPEVRGNRRQNAVPATTSKKRKTTDEPPPNPKKIKKPHVPGGLSMDLTCATNLDLSGSYGNTFGDAVPLSRTQAELLEQLEKESLDCDEDTWASLQAGNARADSSCVETTAPLPTTEVASIDLELFQVDFELFQLEELEVCELLQ